MGLFKTIEEKARALSDYKFRIKQIKDYEFAYKELEETLKDANKIREKGAEVLKDLDKVEKDIEKAKERKEKEKQEERKGISGFFAKRRNIKRINKELKLLKKTRAYKKHLLKIFNTDEKDSEKRLKMVTKNKKKAEKNIKRAFKMSKPSIKLMDLINKNKDKLIEIIGGKNVDIIVERLKLANNGGIVNKKEVKRALKYLKNQIKQYNKDMKNKARGKRVVIMPADLLEDKEYEEPNKDADKQNDEPNKDADKQNDEPNKNVDKQDGEPDKDADKQDGEPTQQPTDDEPNKDANKPDDDKNTSKSTKSKRDKIKFKPAVSYEEFGLSRPTIEIVAQGLELTPEQFLIVVGRADEFAAKNKLLANQRISLVRAAKQLKTITISDKAERKYANRGALVFSAMLNNEKDGRKWLASYIDAYRTNEQQLNNPVPTKGKDQTNDPTHVDQDDHEEK